MRGSLATPEKEVADKLEIIGSTPLPHLKFAHASHARWLITGNLGDPQFSLGRPDRQQWLNADSGAKELLGCLVPAILVEFQLVVKSSPVGSVNDHGIGKFGSEQKIDSTRKNPVADTSEGVVIR